MINCETMIPNFKRDYDSKLCPLKDLLFDSKKMYDKEKKNYKDILKTGEDKDENGNPNLYFLKEKFMVVVLANMSDSSSDDEIMQMLLDQLDHVGDWKKFYVTGE